MSLKTSHCGKSKSSLNEATMVQNEGTRMKFKYQNN